MKTLGEVQQQIMRDASGLQKHKQAAIAELVQKYDFYSANMVRQWLSSGVSMDHIIDRLIDITTILQKHRKPERRK